MTESPAVVAAIETELHLLDPAVRSSAELIGEVLHPEFRAFGSSGRSWDRRSLIAHLTAHDAPAPGPSRRPVCGATNSPRTWCC